MNQSACELPTVCAMPKTKRRWHHRMVVLWENRHTYWHNFRNRKVARAYRTLARAMQADPDYANSWQANYAMTILDRSNRKLTAAECNEIADILMRHCWRVKKHNNSSPTSAG